MGLFRRKKPDPPATPAAANPAAPATPATPATPGAAKSATAPAGGSAANASPASSASPAKAATGGGAAAPAAGAGPQTVQLVDAFGRPVALPREQWRKEVLPQMVAAYAHAPERLAAMLLQHLHEGLAADLLPSALRLATVDPDPERGLSVLAAVQRGAGDLDAALGTLRELQQKRPESIAAKVGIAVVKDQQGDRAGATALLWAALQQDSNHPDALTGWLAWEHARRGEAAYDGALAEVCALPRAWRAQLWLARRAVEQKRVDDAVAIWRKLLAEFGDEPDALPMIAGDLVRAGRADLVGELVMPRYRIEAHHPTVGIAILHHHLQNKDHVRGMALLHELRVRFQRALDQQLGAFDAEFTRLALPPAPVVGAQPKVSLYRMDRPLWYSALGEPEFLLPKVDGVRGTIIAGLAVQVANQSVQVGREDELGRLSRSLPLFLAEQLWLMAKVPSSVALPVADAGGWVVPGVPWAESRLADLLNDAERQRLRIVTGLLVPEGNSRKVTLYVYDAAQRTRTGECTVTGEEGKMGPALLSALQQLGPLLGVEGPLQPAVGNEVFWDRYATGQAQLAALVVAHAGAMAKDRVFGHRAILEWLLAVALDERRSVQARLQLAAGICADAAIGSKVHRELAAPVAELFRVEPANSPFAQLGVMPLRALGLMQLWQHRRAEIVAAGGEPYRQWLARVEPQAGSA